MILPTTTPLSCNTPTSQWCFCPVSLIRNPVVTSGYGYILQPPGEKEPHTLWQGLLPRPSLLPTPGCHHNTSSEPWGRPRSNPSLLVSERTPHSPAPSSDVPGWEQVRFSHAPALLRAVHSPKTPQLLQGVVGAWQAGGGSVPSCPTQTAAPLILTPWLHGTQSWGVCLLCCFGRDWKQQQSPEKWKQEGELLDQPDFRSCQESTVAFL